MMNKKIFSFFILLCLVISCKSKNEPPKEGLKDSFQFAPVIELLKADADDVIKTPYYLYSIKETVNANQKDSSALSREAFKTIITPLLNISLNNNDFKEISFEDLSTESISFITTSISSSNPIKSITTLLDIETKKLKSIYIIIQHQTQDTIQQQQYFWKAGRSLTISNTKTLPTKKEIIEKTYINWNDKQK